MNLVKTMMAGAVGFAAGAGAVTKLVDYAPVDGSPRFIDRMIEVYRHYSHLDYKFPAQFLPAELGDRTGIIGAALLVP